MIDVSSYTVLASGLRFPEGPAFDSIGRLWFVELKGGGLGYYANDKTTLIAAGAGSEPNGIAIDAHDRIWFCDANRCAIRRYLPKSDLIEDVVTGIDGNRLFRPNDLCFDPEGNLLFTCPGNSRFEPTGYVCCLTPDGALQKIAEDLYFPNGLALTPAGDHLVIAETRRQRLWRGHWDAVQRKWTSAHPWAAVKADVGPDGMAFAANGDLYVAVYSGGCVNILSSNGSSKSVLKVPGANPTNCAFDPSSERGLIVTEAENGQLVSYPNHGPGAALFK